MVWLKFYIHIAAERIYRTNIFEGSTCTSSIHSYRYSIKVWHRFISKYYYVKGEC